MRRITVIFLIALTACASAPPATQPLLPLQRTAAFSLSNDVLFGKHVLSVYAQAKGNVTLSERTMAIGLSETTLIANPVFDKSKHIRSYAVCLAGGEYGGKWKIMKCSKEVPINVTVEPKGSRSIADLAFSIDVNDVRSLKGNWLVVQLTMYSDGSDGYTYTHSQKDIFEGGR